MGLNALQSYAASLSGEEELNQSLRRGFQRNPASYAQALQRMKATGVAPDLQEGMEPELDLDSKVQSVPVQDIIKRHPVLAKYLKNDEFATLAQDDIPALSDSETAFQRAKRIEDNRVRFENYRRGNSVAGGLVASFVKGIDNLLAAPSEVQEAMLNATVGQVFGPDAVKRTRSLASKISPQEAILQHVGKWARERFDALTMDERETQNIMIADPKTGEQFLNLGSVNPFSGAGLENVAKTVASEAGPMAAQIAITMATGGLGAVAQAPNAGRLLKLSSAILRYAKSPAGMIEVGRTVAGQYQQGIADQVAKGLTEDEAKIKVAPGALLAGVFSSAAGAPMEGKVIEDLLERVAKAPGGETLVKRILGRLASTATTGGKEGTQEVLNGIGEDLAEWITYNPDKTIKEAAANAIVNFVGGAAMGGATGFTMHGTQRTQETLDRLEGVANSKLAQLSPEKAAEIVQEQAKDGAENILIPAQRYFQTVTEAGVDPVALSGQLGVQNLEEAMLAGTDIVIPVGAWVTATTPELRNALRPDVRLSPGEATLREEQEAAPTDEALLNETTEEAQNLQTQAEIDALPVPEIEKYRESVKQAFIKGGVAEDTADAVAALWIRPVQTFIESGDITAEQAAQLWPLDVSAYRKGEEKKSLTDIVLDRLKEFGHGVKEYFQSVFHGSPYRFDKFSLKHMGKGEGAQVYGWGLYFAGSKDVAEWYRVNLSAKENEVIFHGKSGLNQTIGNSGREGIAKRFITTNEGNIDKALAELKSGMESFPNDASFRQAYEWLERNRERVEYRPKDTGQLYKADIPDDGSYLLWDKPLKDQLPPIQNSIRAMLRKMNYLREGENGPRQLTSAWKAFILEHGRMTDGDSGSALYEGLSREMGGDEQASKYLYSLGISGIKYLDGSSRSGGKGSYNYVVFDDNAVKILKTYYQGRKDKAEQTELNRRADEAKSLADEFAVFDAAVKEVQVGDVSSDKRGFIQFGGERIHIGLLEGRNLSTLLHETSHAFLQMLGDVAEMPNASERTKALWADTLGTFRGQSAKVLSDALKIDPFQIIRDGDVWTIGAEQFKTRQEAEAKHDALLMSLRDELRVGGDNLVNDTINDIHTKRTLTTAESVIHTVVHEQFASWGERYFMEGKSPSESLKPLMVRFQAWMQLVYKTLEKLGVKINKEVRSVFDRLLATDAEIAAVSNKPELFTSAEDMGATPAEYAVLVEAKAKAIQEGHERLQAEVMQDLVREQKKAYKDEKAQARAEVEAEVDSRPDMKAMAALKDGTIKLDRKSVEEQFGTAEGIPTVEDGGMEIGYVADLLGYENGASLYNALKNLPDRNGLIDALTEEIINARYGDVLLDGSIAEKAVDAMHGDGMGDVLAMELRHLMRLKRVTDKVQAAKSGEEKAAQKAADVQIPSVSTVREQARNLIAGTNLRNMNANKYWLAEEKYSREAYKLKGKKDYAGAAEAKIKELMNHYLYIEARNTKAFEERRASEVRRKLRNKEFLGMLGKAGKAFQDAWLQICDEYEFEKVSGVKLDERRASLLELQKAHEDAGIDIDPAVLTAIPKNYRELPMTELRSVHEALTNIEHVASETQKVMVGNEKMDVESVARELIYAAMTNNKVQPLRSSGETVGRVDKAAREIQGLNAYMKQMIRIIDQLDGGDSNGIWHRAIWQVWSDAHGRELELGGAINAKIQELMEKTGIFSKSYLDQSIGVRLPGEESDLNHRRAIGFLFNLGSQENRNAMRGWIVNPDGFPSPVIDEILSKISKQEADFVQGVWDVLESMWPAIEAQEMRQKGITPTRKTATPIAFKTRDGVDVELRGGYFPLAGEPFERVGKIQMSGDLSQITESGYTYATTSRSHTKEVTGAAYRVNLDFGFVLGKHLTGVIKDLTHREAVLSMNRLLAREDVSKALLQSIGPEMEAEFLPWLKATVNNRNAGPQEGGKLLQWLMQRRHGMVVAQLALNISSIVIQTPDMFKVWTEVPALDLARAFATLLQNPVKTINAIRELSPNRMRYFEHDYHRELMQFFESRNFLEQQKGEFVEWSMVPFQIMGQLSAFPAWLGTFQKGMAEHGDQARAVREADTVVDRVVQFGDPAHLSRMMREKGWTSLFTMFQGDLNIWYNIITSATGEHKAPKVAKSILAYCLSGILGNLLVGRGPKDDEDWREWAILKALIGIPELIPVVGDAVKAGVAHLQGKSLASQQYSPVFGAILKPFVAGAEIKKQVQEGGNAADAAFSTIDAVGTWTGFPGTAQALKTSKYLKRLKEGEEHPDDAGDVVQGVLFNKRNN